MTLDAEERALVRRVREGEDGAVDLLRRAWARRAALDDAFGSLSAPDADEATTLVAGRVVLLWVEGARRWEIASFEPEAW